MKKKNLYVDMIQYEKKLKDDANANLDELAKIKENHLRRKIKFAFFVIVCFLNIALMLCFHFLFAFLVLIFGFFSYKCLAGFSSDNMLNDMYCNICNNAYDALDKQSKSIKKQELRIVESDDKLLELNQYRFQNKDKFINDKIDQIFLNLRETKTELGYECDVNPICFLEHYLLVCEKNS